MFSPAVHVFLIVIISCCMDDASCLHESSGTTTRNIWHAERHPVMMPYGLEECVIPNCLSLFSTNQLLFLSIGLKGRWLQIMIAYMLPWIQGVLLCLLLWVFLHQVRVAPLVLSFHYDTHLPLCFLSGLSMCRVL